MLDAGKYAAEVGFSYLAALALIGALILYVWRRSARVKQALREIETRQKGASDG